MIVIDASAMANALVYADDRGRKARAVLGRDTEWAAPEHWKAEVFSVIRGLALGRKIAEDQALDIVDQIPHLGVESVPIDHLFPRMWELRLGIGASHSAYVALAEARGLTLVTSDARLARAAMTFCRIEVVN